MHVVTLSPLAPVIGVYCLLLQGFSIDCPKSKTLITLKGFQNNPAPDTGHWLLQAFCRVPFVTNFIHTKFCFTDVRFHDLIFPRK